MIQMPSPVQVIMIENWSRWLNDQIIKVCIMESKTNLFSLLYAALPIDVLVPPSLMALILLEQYRRHQRNAKPDLSKCVS